MALTNQELTDELEFIKVVLNKLQTAVEKNLASKAQLVQLNLLRQNDITDLQTRVTQLEADVALLKLQL